MESVATNQTESSGEIERAYDFCQTITKTHAKSFYFAANFLKPHKRKPIYALYALCRLVDDAVDEAEIKSEFDVIDAVDRWKSLLNEIYGERSEAGAKTDAQKFVSIAWGNLLQKYQIKRDLPLELMRGVLMDTHINRYATFSELYIYCYRVASTVGLMSSEIFGYENPETLEYAEALGIAMQLTNILRDIKEDAVMNRIYLPNEDLQRFNVTERQIFNNDFNDNFKSLMKFQIERARYYYAEAEKGISLLSKDVRFTVLLAARIYGKILDEIEKLDYNVFTKRAHTTKFQKIRTIPRVWREARKLL